jgi:phospholipase C
MADIRHIFVLMLENRSFDHLFALSGISGIHAATSADKNSFGGQTYSFGPGAPARMPRDPHHGFGSVMTQLAGAGGERQPATPYPPRTNAGFVANFATGHKQPPSPAERGSVMLAVDLPNESPALYTLAREYALCDQWYSSMPGPTWPNRFFVHGASCAGMADGPTAADIAKWETVSGFRYPHGSIFDRLGRGNYRLFQNRAGPAAGRLPQVGALKGISYGDVRPLRDLETELANGDAAPYTFIEPAYGNIVNDTYLDGSSQHPLDGLAEGDRLIARVYRAIRNSPVWEHSLLIITYDEHGGFYDSAVPAKAAPPPNDGKGAGNNPYGFDFSVYGVRVPAVIVSPWIAKGLVDHRLYDHASILATVERRFHLDPLTDRDRLAGDLLHLVSGPLRPDADCPRELPELPRLEFPAAVEEAAVASPLEPVEEGSNLQGFLFVAEKAQREVPAATLELPALPPPTTKGEAELYLRQVVPQLEAVEKAGPGASD